MGVLGPMAAGESRGGLHGLLGRRCWVIEMVIMARLASRALISLECAGRRAGFISQGIPARTDHLRHVSRGPSSRDRIITRSASRAEMAKMANRASSSLERHGDCAGVVAHCISVGKRTPGPFPRAQ